MKGSMKATYVGSGSDRAAVISYLSYHIQRVINSSNITAHNVQQAVFIGTRILPESPTSASTQGVKGSSSSGQNVALASGVSIAAVLAMFIVYFAMARRRRKISNPVEVTGKEKHQVLLAVGNSNDIDAAPVLVSTNTTKTLECNHTSEDDEPHCGKIEGAEVHSTPHLDISANSITTAQTAAETVTGSVDTSLATNNDRSVKATNLSTETVIAKSKLPTVIDILPPKPPTGPSSKSKSAVLPVVASKPLKQRRRKKKKKKKPMIRVNSREKINEMETITEGEEETVGDKNDDEEGSEYSWCSTSDSDPGSRDPSPARSRGSQEPSPPRSTGSGGSHNTNDSLILAMSNSGSWDSSSIGLPAASSESGDQKPKINRLPPPWI
jgi:hypothetical protein